MLALHTANWISGIQNGCLSAEPGVSPEQTKKIAGIWMGLEGVTLSEVNPKE